LISWGRSQIYLPFFFPFALVRALVACSNKIDLILIGDPVLSPIGTTLKKLFQLPTVITVHGLDITFSFPFYQSIVPGIVDQYDQIVCISENTRQLCLDRSIRKSHCRIIHPGVESIEIPAREVARKWLENQVGRSLEGICVLTTVGRLVERKGGHWFTEHVMPHLSSRFKCIYVLAGAGPDEQKIQQTIKAKDLQESVILLGSVPEERLNYLYRGSDLFVMPNIPVEKDVEGFGLVALEAAANAVSVVASDLEGIRDAVHPGRTGKLIEPQNDLKWISYLSSLLEKPQQLITLGEKARRFVERENNWAKTVDQYIEIFENLFREDRKKTVVSKQHQSSKS
jgi:glycosyltransferase involved in cell wall biosynthesis